MIMLFSGRFDKPHLGHIITISKLMQQYDKVIVVVLDYKEQHYPVDYRVKVLKDGLAHVKGDVQVISNNVHFGFINKHGLKALPEFDVYGSGNMTCNDNMCGLGHEFVRVDRYPGYTASDDVKFRKLVNFFNEEILND